jgi:hypothetical protein
MPDVDSSALAYLEGANVGLSQTYAYLAGGDVVLDDTPAFLAGDIFVSDTTLAFLYGEGSLLSSRFAYLFGIVRGNVDAYLEGSVTGDDSVANDYIILRSSDSSIDKKFKVLSDYDDGTPEKAGTAKRTLGGGVSYSVGGIYYSWNPTIRVRHTEPDPDYGDLQDLIDLYELNNPNGTPSNVITFIDHHNVSHSILMIGSLQKAVLGSAIEGSEAHLIVRVTMQEKPNA